MLSIFNGCIAPHCYKLATVRGFRAWVPINACEPPCQQALTVQYSAGKLLSIGREKTFIPQEIKHEKNCIGTGSFAAASHRV